MWLEVRPPERSDPGWMPGDAFAPTAANDGAVVRRALNASQLCDLYRRDQRLLKTLVRRVVRSPTDAEDVVQDAFLRVWRAMELGLIRSPRAVLFKTARHLALNHVRSPRNHSVDAAPVQEPANDGPTAEERMILDEDHQACRQAFHRLPPQCREALALRVVDECSYKEMSETLGVSVSTLEKRYIRGRKLCRDILSSGVEHARAGAFLHRRPSPMMVAAE